MAECGVCRAVIPLDSKECPECDAKFSGVSDVALGECGACKALVPLDSTRCPECGVVFVADDVIDILRKWVNDTGVDIRKLFDRFDENSDGMIDSGELKRGLLSLNLADLPPSQIDRLINEIDRDANGLIDLDEFEIIINGEGEEVPEDAQEQSTEESEVETEADEDTEDIVIEEEITEEEMDEGSSEEESEDEDDESEEELEAEMDDEEFDIEDDEEVSEEAIEMLSPIHILANMMDENDISAQRFFNDLDKDGNGSVSRSELISVIQEKYSDLIDIEDVEGLIEKMDADGDGMIDIMEFTESMESLDDHQDTLDDDAKAKEFPSPMQRRMMSKSWNDAVWPLIHTGFGIMIVLLLVNALIGPVDGSGGMIEYVAKDPTTIVMNEDGTTLLEGDIYGCDTDYQEGDCANTLTPLAGDSSSMPKGFYWDGILFLVLAIGGIIGSLFTHLALAPSWRERARAMKEVKGDKADAEETESESDEEETEESEDHDDSDDDTQEDDNEESDDEGDSDDDEDSDDEEGDDEIDIGSHVGLTFDDEEVFGTIIEFDDDEGTVTIKEDGSGDEVTGYQDDMFLE
jgi:Ca2+-binding EF-hand superfamily protein